MSVLIICREYGRRCCKMGKITGIGGVFMKCADMEKTMEWYRQLPGFETGDETAVILRPAGGEGSYQVMGYFKEDDDYFSPSREAIMFNLTVDDLDEVLEKLREKGIETVGEVGEWKQGRFAWIMDPDGRKIELWEPSGKE